MDSRTIQSTKIYNEMNKTSSKEWFYYTPKKFILGVDTFYYNVKLKPTDDTELFLAGLAFRRDDLIKTNVPQKFYGDIFLNECRNNIFYLTKKNCFDVCVDNKNLQVQLRSKFLWEHGLNDAFACSLASIQELLDDLETADIVENRIDIAHHTNYFQDLDSYFKEEDLAAMQVSRMKRFCKQGELKQDEVIGDYILFGKRDNVCMRIYNKTKQAIEVPGKAYFIPIWLKNGLISKFDKYIFDDCFQNGSGKWEYRHIARCRFYLEHGADETIKREITELLQQKAPYAAFKKLADRCVPDLTLITNVEFQLSRSFTKTLKVPTVGNRMDNIIQALPSIRKYLVTKVIRFVRYKGDYKNMKKSERPTADWWNRLIACDKAEVDALVCRDYQMKADLQLAKNRGLNAIATLAALNSRTQNLESDMNNFYQAINKNDREKYDYYRNKKTIQNQKQII